MFFKEAHRFLLVLLHFRMFLAWKFERKVHLFCFPHLCCFNDSWKMERETPILIYILTFAHRKKTTNQPRISEVEISKGDIPTETHSSFLAGFTTNQCTVTPQPCKYWHIRLVSKRMEILCLERGDSQARNKARSKVWAGSKTWAVTSWHSFRTKFHHLHFHLLSALLSKKYYRYSSQV